MLERVLVNWGKHFFFFFFFVIRVFGQESRIVLWLKASSLRD